MRTVLQTKRHCARWPLRQTRRIRPALHLFGHIHQDGGFWREDGIAYTNVTTWEGVRGATVIDLNVGTREVVEIVVPPPRKVRNKSGPLIG
jgi:hypothetical protein